MSKEIIIPTDRIMCKGRYCVAGARLTYMWGPQNRGFPKRDIRFF
jgi:hypothetical protein